MSPHQVPDFPLMCTVAFAGFVIGGLVSYFANLLLHSEGLISYPSVGTYCGHRGKIAEAIPLLPFVLKHNSCKYCQRRVKWHYLLTEVLLAIAFLFLVWHLGLRFYTFGMMTFVTILFAICITDFRTKIIPHEITYPAILLGIIFSIITKASVLGALAGIGVSYILFDFLAFYGLQIYTWCNKPSLAPSQQFVSMDRQMHVRSDKPTKRSPSMLSKDFQSTYTSVSKKENLGPRLYSRGIPLEDLEIIGGGDAVLSALIAAWLGWQKLVLALIAGFLVGTVMGAVYVFIELGKERLLKTIVSPVISCVLALGLLAILMLLMLANSANESVLNMPYLPVLSCAVIAGCLLGVIIAGSKISKPFPFGPALAIGAFMAIFRDNPPA